jgi:hypothetical protein
MSKREKSFVDKLAEGLGLKKPDPKEVSKGKSFSRGT